MTNEAGEIVRRVTSTAWFEPSLAAEGILWFQDLLVPDHTGALPFITSGIMFANIYTTKNTVESDGSRRWPGVLRRTLLFVSLLIGPLCQELPAALMLYWSSSTGQTTQDMSGPDYLKWSRTHPVASGSFRRLRDDCCTIAVTGHVRSIVSLTSNSIRSATLSRNKSKYTSSTVSTCL